MHFLSNRNAFPQRDEWRPASKCTPAALLLILYSYSDICRLNPRAAMHCKVTYDLDRPELFFDLMSILVASMVPFLDTKFTSIVSIP
jgi:hypothetical protein